MRTPDKRRFINAVAHRESKEVPLFEMEVDIAIVNEMMGKQYDMSLHSYELPAVDCVEWNRRMGNDMIYFSHIWRLGRKEKTDAQGRIHYIDGTMKTRSALKDIQLPDLADIQRRLEALLNEIDGSGFGVVCSTQNASLTVPTAMGYEDFYMNAVGDPDFIIEFQKHIHDYSMRELEMYLKYPIDCVKVTSCLIADNGPMLGPELMEKFEYSHMRDHIKLIKDHNLPVFFHADGDIETLIPMFIQMGADILNPLDPCDGKLDIYKVKADYGDKIVLCGNIDINGVLVNGSPEDVARDVREHIEKLNTNGGYIVSSSHELHQLIPIQNVYALRDATHNFPDG